MLRFIIEIVCAGRSHTGSSRQQQTWAANVVTKNVLPVLKNQGEMFAYRFITDVISIVQTDCIIRKDRCLKYLYNIVNSSFRQLSRQKRRKKMAFVIQPLRPMQIL